MSHRPKLRRLVGSVLIVLSVAAWDAHGADAQAHFPDYAPHPGLPGKFNEVLQVQHAKVVAHRDDSEELRKLARLYHANRLFAEARSCYRLIGSIGGLNARDHYYLADIEQNESDLVGAQAELRASLQTEPNYIPARLGLAESFFKTGQEDEAEKEYRALLSLDPSQPQAKLGLARIELQRGNDDAAVAILEEVMGDHPDATAAAALFAQVLERRGETDRAIAMTQYSLQKPGPAPADPWLDALLADCYDIQRLSLTFEEFFKLGKMDEALPLLDRLSVLDPDGPITKMFSGFSHAKALQHITAVREYYEALGKGGDPEKICPYLVQSLLALGKGAEAAKLMADFYEKMPDSVPIAKAFAEVTLQQGDDKLARQLLSKVLQREPYLAAQNMSMAKLLWTSGDHNGAVPFLQRVAVAIPGDVPARALLGEYYLEKSDPISAIKPLEEARVYAPAKTPAQKRLTELLATAYSQAGNGAAAKGQLTPALDHFEKRIRLVPEDLSGYAAKANLCVQLGQFGRAAEALEKMAALQPDNPTIYLSLADVLYQDGKKDAARINWQKALQFAAPADTELRNALAERLSGRITEDTFK